jgi:hypothetical protein
MYLNAMAHATPYVDQDKQYWGTHLFIDNHKGNHGNHGAQR